MGTRARATSAPLRVGTFVSFYPPHLGGLEVVAQRVATGLAERGHRVGLITCADPAPAGQVVEGGVTVRRIRALNALEHRYGIPFPVFSPALIWHSWRLVRRSDVVHVHDMLYLSSWVAAILCRLTRTPYVVTQHVGMVEHPARVVRLAQILVMRTVGALVLRGADLVLPISPVIEEWTRSRLPEVRTRVLRNGVDRERFRPPRPGERAEIRRRFGLPANEVLVLYVGRFVPKKGFDVVSAATGPEYKTVFVGGERPIGLPESADRVFLGALSHDQTAAVYRACDIFVCASVGEGPMTPMEALLSGCTVLVNDDPAMHALGLGAAVRSLPMTPQTLRSGLVELAHAGRVDGPEEQRLRVVDELPGWADYLDVLEGAMCEVAVRRTSRAPAS